jgi:hypothetical protein
MQALTPHNAQVSSLFSSMLISLPIDIHCDPLMPGVSTESHQLIPDLAVFNRFLNATQARLEREILFAKSESTSGAGIPKDLG